MVEQPEVLEYQTDPAPHRRTSVLAERRGVLVEHRDQAPRRPQCQEKQAKEGRLARPRGSGEELKRFDVNAESEIAQDLRAEPVAQADILESDHAVLRIACCYVGPSPAGPSFDSPGQ